MPNVHINLAPGIFLGISLSMNYISRSKYLPFCAADPLAVNQKPLNSIIIMKKIAYELGGRLPKQLTLVVNTFKEHFEIIGVEAFKDGELYDFVADNVSEVVNYSTQ